MILYIDSNIAGISGDMLLGALIDLGVDSAVLMDVVDGVREKTGCKVSVEVRDVKKKGIRATRVKVEAEGGLEAENLVSYLESLASEFDLTSSARKFSENTLQTLLMAEKRVHASKQVHLHEMSSPDTLVDIIGCAKLLDELRFFMEKGAVYASPVLVGSGRIETSHGAMTVPPLVTMEILKNLKIPFKFSTIKGELATPTGVSLLGNLNPVFGYPLFPVRILASGMGAGGYDLKDGPNVLRVMSLASDHEVERIAVLKTSVDDVSGEVLGYLMEKLYSAGALDVQILPSVTKKNRPGYVIIVLSKLGSEKELAETLMRETGSLGVRIGTDQMRFAARRQVKEIKVSLSGYEGPVRVKVSRLGGRVHIKAEYDDARRISKKTGLPLREVVREIEEQARKIL